MATCLFALMGLLTPLAAPEFASAQSTPIPPLTLPAGRKIVAVDAFPSQMKLTGQDDRAQVLVTGKLDDGSLVDLTHYSSYTSSNPALLQFTGKGRVTPLGNGTTQVVAQHGALQARVQVVVAGCESLQPINFTNQVVPIFTKLTCNSGGCHGKSAGQNGFKLSLLGFEPDIDYASLVREERARRVQVTAPENSLLLTKAAGQVAHGGGRKLETDSDEYRLVRRWIASGLPWGQPNDPTLAGISVHPETRVMQPGSVQQFLVQAHYSDGRIEDITRRAQYESNAQDIATVDGSALVRTAQSSGEASIMVRYQDRVATFRATVPLAKPSPPWQFPQYTVVDLHTSTRWKELGLAPSDLATDAVFLRRVSLDLTGTLPTVETTRAFLADKDPAKRDKLIDRLVDSPE